jgi:hypothetical protein
MSGTPLTPQERRLQVLLRILALMFGLAAFGYLLPALDSSTPKRGAVKL